MRRPRWCWLPTFSLASRLRANDYMEAGASGLHPAIQSSKALKVVTAASSARIASSSSSRNNSSSSRSSRHIAPRRSPGQQRITAPSPGRCRPDPSARARSAHPLMLTLRAHRGRRGVSPCSPSEPTDARGEESPRRLGRGQSFASRRGATASERGRSYRDRSRRRPPPTARHLRTADESHRGGPTVVGNRRPQSSQPPPPRTPRACAFVHAWSQLQRAIATACPACRNDSKAANSVIVRRLLPSDPEQRGQAGPERPRCVDRPPNTFQQCGSLGNVGRIGNFERRELSVFDDRRHKCLNRQVPCRSGRRRDFPVAAKNAVVEAPSRRLGRLPICEIGEEQDEAKDTLRGHKDRICPHQHRRRSTFGGANDRLPSPRLIFGDQRFHSSAYGIGVGEKVGQFVEALESVVVDPQPFAEGGVGFLLPGATGSGTYCSSERWSSTALRPIASAPR